MCSHFSDDDCEKTPARMDTCNKSRHGGGDGQQQPNVDTRSKEQLETNPKSVHLPHTSRPKQRPTCAATPS